MGIVRMGPPEKLIEKLKKDFDLKHFVETGTYKGNTSAWASKIFEKVSTIELSKILYEQNLKKYKTIKNVNFIMGSSDEKLSEIIKENPNEEMIFWLDAHPCGGDTAGENIPWPVISEIEVINELTEDAFIFIDDVRFFLAPYCYNKCFDITTVINALNSGKNKRYITIFEDVIVAVPIKAYNVMFEYCSKVSNEALLTPAQKCISFIKKNTRGIKKLFKRYRTFGFFDASELSVQRLELINCIKKLKLKRPSILEAGAADGGDTLYTSRLLPGSKIYAFEPVSHNFAKMKENIKHKKNIKYYNLGLSDKTQEVEMYISNPEDSGFDLALSSSLLKPKEHLNIHSHIGFDKKETIKVVNLDEWAEKNKVKNIDIMWLDLQGAEYLVLKAAPKILKTVKIIFTEVSHRQMYENAPLFPEFKSWLESEEFSLYKLFDEESGMSDAIFIRNN